MHIEIIGSGCPTCKEMFEIVSSVAREIGLEEKIEYTTNTEKIIAMGVMQTPVFAIDGRPMLVGPVIDEVKIREILLRCKPEE